ncbi:MAG: FeoB-associated Cys-rich membrane protein [Opitutales bacterium]
MIESIITGVIVFAAAAYLAYKLWPRRRSDSACGGNCGCKPKLSKASAHRR